MKRELFKLSKHEGIPKTEETIKIVNFSFVSSSREVCQRFDDIAKV